MRLLFIGVNANAAVATSSLITHHPLSNPTTLTARPQKIRAATLAATLPSDITSMRQLILALGLILCAHLTSINAAGSNSPHHVRLAYVGSTGMSIGWTTNTSTSSPPSVTYSSSATFASPLTASSNDVRNYGFQYYHYVPVTGLQPSTEYYYSITHDASDVGGSATNGTFKTARAAGDLTPYTANVVGDLGYYNGQPTSTALLKNFGGHGVDVPEYLIHVSECFLQ